MNKVLLVGTCGEIERKEHNGKSFIEFTVGIKNDYNGEVDQYPVSVWGKAVDSFSANEGDLVSVEGSLKSREYNDKRYISASVFRVTVLESASDF
jgi:single-stranded DNA-binding protein